MTSLSVEKERKEKEQIGLVLCVVKMCVLKKLKSHILYQNKVYQVFLYERVEMTGTRVCCRRLHGPEISDSSPA